MRALLEHLGGRWPQGQPNLQVQVLSSAFYRNQAAYIVGKVVNGNDQLPFVVPVIHDADGRLALDAVLLEPESISVVFSLSRAYFLVEMDVPSAFVEFLRSIMPAKPRSEIYTSLGLAGQGKTLFFRDLLHHLHHSRDRLVEAPGARGQVMHVFYLPSYPYVFKVIKDVFGPAKQMSRDAVKRKFQMVKEADRVGRMVDATEFEDLALPHERFAPELLADLQALAPSAIVRDGDRLIVRHCYVERRMTPLDIYLEHATRRSSSTRCASSATRSASSPTRTSSPGTCSSRTSASTATTARSSTTTTRSSTSPTASSASSPTAARTTTSATPRLAVTHLDVFPEEIATFLLGRSAVREAFLRHHGELLQPAYWRERQRRLAAGELADFFPYPESARLCNRYGES